MCEVLSFISWHAAGVSVFPLHLDGTKEPACKKWNPFRQRFATPDELAEWSSGRYGIGLVCGLGSGCLEVIDFDDGALFEPWKQQVGRIVTALPVVQTGGNGYHVLYRCREICGNLKIALDPGLEKQTLIESRGEGGFVVGVGSPLSVHESRNPYIQVSGPDLPEIPVIEVHDRRRLWQAARRFDRSGIVAKARQAAERRKQWAGRKALPGPASAMPWPDILEPHGWHSRDGKYWTRPDKRFGTSAIIGHARDGTEILTVFSSNAGPLSPVTAGHRSWNKDRAFAALAGRIP